MLDNCLVEKIWKSNLPTSAETSACFDGSNSHDFDTFAWFEAIRLTTFATSLSMDELPASSSFISLAFCCWFNAIILTKFTTSSSEEELHELVSSVVDCASASNDIKTDRQITVNTRVKLPDLGMSAWYHTLMVNTGCCNWSCQFDVCSAITRPSVEAA